MKIEVKTRSQKDIYIRVILKVVPNPTFFGHPLHFVTPFLFLSIKFKKTWSNNKTQHEIVEFCYDLHLMQLFW
jgi:hypothetical protein